jgi:hypothetical protein
MSHSATLYLERTAIVVQEFHWGIVQPTDSTHRPQAGVLAGKISLVVAQLHHPLLDAWMASEGKLCSGELLAEAADGTGTVRRLRFVEALCVNQGMAYHDGGGAGLVGTLSLLLTARELHVDHALVINNAWPGYPPA